MSEEEKGIYVSFTTYLKGPAHEAFLKAVAVETEAWIGSPAGKQAIRSAVTKSIGDLIDRQFGWSCEKDARQARFKKIISDAFYAELFKAVGASPTDEAGKIE